MKRKSPYLITIALFLVACDSSPSDPAGPTIPVNPAGPAIHEPLLLEGPSSRFFDVVPVGDEWLVGTGSISARNVPGLFAFHRPTNTFRELEPVSGVFRVFGEEVYAIATDSRELVRHELRGTDRRKLSDPAHTVSRFWISPDGGHIAYLATPTLSSARAELFVVPTGGGAAVQVSRASAEGEVIANTSDRNGPMATIPRFAGDRLLYASEFDGDDDRWELVSVRFDGSGVVRLNGNLGETATVRTGRGSEGFSFVVSPDGAEVIYASNEASAGGSELYRIAPDGTGRQRLHEAVEETGGYTFGYALFHYVAGYLSDGTLLFAIDLDGDGLRLFRRETSGTVQRLAGDTVFSPRHFPEELPGDELLVVTQRGIERAPLNGDAPTVVASIEEYSHLSGQTNTPALTADGSRVVFMARVTGTSYENLYVVPFAGGETRRVSDEPEEDRSFRGVISAGVGRRSFLLSPDGRSVAYLYQGDSSAIQVRWSGLDGAETRVVTPERENVGLGTTTTVLIAFDQEVVFANDNRRWTESLLYTYDPQTDVRVALEEHFPAFISEDVEGWVSSESTNAVLAIMRQVLATTSSIWTRGPAGESLCKLTIPSTPTSRAVVSTPSNAQLSSDGTRGYFRYSLEEGDPFQFYWVDTEACETRPLLADLPASTSMGGLTLSADGQTAVFTMTEDDGMPTLYATDGDGGNLRALSDPETEGRHDGLNNGDVIFAPDGQHVVYTTNTGVYSVRTDGTGKARLDQGMTPEAPLDGGLCHQIDFLPSGEVVFITGQTFRRNTQPWIAALDGSSPPRALDLGAGDYVIIDSSRCNSVQVAESGRLVMLTRDSTGTSRLISTAPDGTNPAVIDEGNPSAADVLGDQMVYRFQEESGASSLRMANADGAGPPTTLFEIPAEGDRTLWGVLPVPPQTGSPTQVLLLFYTTDEVELWSSDLVTGETVELATTERIILSQGRIFVTPTRFFGLQTLPRGAGSRIVGIDLTSGEVDVIVSGEFDHRSIELYAVANNGTQLQFSGDFNRVGVVELFDVPTP